MKKQSNHRMPKMTIMLVVLLLGAGSISVVGYMMGLGVSQGSQRYLGAAQVPLVVDEPTEGPATPYPRKPGEPQVGEVPTPSPMPNYPVPAITPVPAGADADFGDSPKPAVGYTPVPTPLPSDPIDQGAIPFHISNPTLMTNVSVNVIKGTVDEIQPARWSTKDGDRPANPRAPGNSDVIFRPVGVTVDSYLKGSGPARVIVMALGGAVGGDRTTWGDSRYTFSVGEKVVLFLSNLGVNPDLKVDGYIPWMADEHYTLDGNEATNGYHTLTTQQLLDEIAEAQK